MSHEHYRLWWAVSQFTQEASLKCHFSFLLLLSASMAGFLRIEGVANMF